MRLASLVSVAVVSAFVVACSSSGGGDDSNVAVADAGLSTSSCETDARKDVYAVGLTKTTAGNIALKVMSNDPSPPERAVNDLVIEMLDPSGQPLDGATITVVPWMPDHGHGSSVKPTTTGMGGGVYDIKNIDYIMPGLWQLTMTVTPAGSTATQTAVFSFCIDG